MSEILGHFVPSKQRYIEALHTAEAWCLLTEIDDEAYRDACGREDEYLQEKLTPEFPDIHPDDLRWLGKIAQQACIREAENRKNN